MCYFQLLYLMPNIFYKSVLVEEQVSLEVYFEAEKSFPCFWTLMKLKTQRKYVISWILRMNFGWFFLNIFRWTDKDDITIQFFASLLYKTKRFYVALGLFCNRSQMTSKCGQCISDTLRCTLCVTFFVLNPLTPKFSLVILVTVCHTVFVMLVWRIWYWINL